MSVYEKFLDKNKSKLCESKSKKVSLKKLKRVNESDAYEKELRYEKVADEHIGLNKLEYDDGSVQYLVYGTTFKDEYIDNKEAAEEFFGDMLDELLEKYGYIDIDKQGVIAFELKDGTEIAVNKLIRADGKFDFEVIIDYDNYPPVFRTEEEALEYVDDFLKEQGYTDAEIEELYEKGYLDESCGKRKPKKPFPRKSLKESAYEKFLDKNKSKLCESKSKKVSLKKLKRVNESDWKDDLAIRKNIYKIVFPILQKELLNVKFIDKRIDNETFVEHFEEYFDIETMFNSKSYISFIGDDYIIQIIEDTFTDYLGYRYEYSEDADNTYDLNVSGLIQQTVDTIVKAIPKMEDALKAKLGEFNASSVKVKSNLLDDAGGINIEYHFKSNDTISESSKDRFVKKVFGKSKLSESRILKRTRKVKVPRKSL